MIVAADHPARGALGVGDHRLGHGEPRRPAGTPLHGAVPARCGRGPGHRRHPGRPAAPRRARRQGCDGLDEPRRAVRRGLRDGRPLHRPPRRGHRAPALRRGQTAAPHQLRRPGLPHHPGVHGTRHRRHGGAPTPPVRRAVHLPPHRRQGPQRPVRRGRDPLDRDLVGPGRHLRLHLAETARHRRPGRHGRGPGDLDAARRPARRRGRRRPGGRVREVAQGAAPAHRPGSGRGQVALPAVPRRRWAAWRRRWTRAPL
jgi:hypothetical protein